MTERVLEASPRFKARIAGAFYLVNIVTGVLALFLRGRLGVELSSLRARAMSL